MQKWGKDARGKPRFRCSSCKLSTQRKRIDVTQKHRLELFRTWLLGKLELSWYATKYGVSRQTLFNWFTPFWLEEPLPKEVDIRNRVLIVDGKYIERSATVLVATTTDFVVFWHFTQRETAATWSIFFGGLLQIPFAVVLDGQRGAIKAVKSRFPGIIIQRCQFHVIHYCLAKLTQNPESTAAIELRFLVLRITRVTTRTEFSVWISDYKSWFHQHKGFLKQKTKQSDNLTPTGRPKWHYTHSRLHAAHSHLKNALPYLFKYLLYPQIPNTTNFVEGAINAPMQEKLRNHRGLNLTQRRVLIAHFLASKQP